MKNNNVKQLGKLESIIGKELFAEVVNEMPGEIFRLPNDAEFFDKAKRDNLIREEYYKGVSRKELALKYNLSLDRLHRILSKTK